MTSMAEEKKQRTQNVSACSEDKIWPKDSEMMAKQK